MNLLSCDNLCINVGYDLTLSAHEKKKEKRKETSDFQNDFKNRFYRFLSPREFFET